ncbi:MAG: molybdopterin-dependent oxidoreductase, partial [Ignavibacteriaceae bacterium]|nr:molybdopterin-dependent oxidoreductase [Ignavibacteriaceae bacterium]
MKNIDIINHVKGESQFVDDIVAPENILYASVAYSKIANGKILELDTNAAKRLYGVKDVFTAEDIPGRNQIGGIIEDEELLACGKVEFIGQPVALVVADKKSFANKAASKIKIDCKELPAITDPREAYKKGDLIIPPRTFSLGDTENNWDDCEFIVEATAESGAQEHLYLETQGAFAYPTEGNGIKIISSTQAPTTVQKIAATVLNLPMNKIEVDVLRIGGGFGGKEDQATCWAVLAALGAYKTKRPVKLILNRQEDIRLTGKRHPYSSDYKIGLSQAGKIICYEVTIYQNAGAAADLSPAIMERTLFHCTNSYYIPNVKATCISCKTNLPPNTAFRGFGGPQGMFVIESAIYKAAEKMNIEPSKIQKINLLVEGNEFPYGQLAENCNARKTWNHADKKYEIGKATREVKKFNKENDLYKKGIAVMPICFGISFTNTSMNQASAL